MSFRSKIEAKTESKRKKKREKEKLKGGRGGGKPTDGEKKKCYYGRGKKKGSNI